MTKALAQTYTTAANYGSQISAALMGACLILAFIYAANIYSAISHTLALQRVQSQEASLNSAVGSLDSRYLALSGKITPDALQAYGLTTGQVSEYITRPASLGRVAMNGNEL